ETANEDGVTSKIERKIAPAVLFASPSVLANSWNKEIVKKSASAMADECIDNDVDMLLAPGINIKRDPRCGRNFEYMSEDPFLAGTLAKEYIDGLQEKGIGSSLKHYCVNNSENARNCINAVVDKRTFMEIYVRNFYHAIKANQTTVMCAYNKVNGYWCSENKEINDILYNKLGFKGAIVSDWGAVHNKIASVKSGLALQMPYRKGMFEEVKSALENGELTEEEIDVCAGRTVGLIERVQQMKELKKVTTDKNDRFNIAEEGALEGIVLLKNNGVLPMKKGAKVAFTGCFSPVMYSGGGSARVETPNMPKQLYETLSQEDETFSSVVENNICTPTWHGNWYFPWSAQEELLPKFDGVDYVIIDVGTSYEVESEGFDRTSIKLTKEEESHIRFIGDHFEGKTIVVIHAGSAIDCSSWIDRVDAVVYAGFAGERVTNALAKILLGKVSPSGKLAETFPAKLEDISCFNTYDDYMTQDYYTDGIYVGYRHYDKKKIKPMFEFGYGLSYAEFAYSDLSVVDNGDDLTVSYKIKNISNVDAKEISQIYMYSPKKVTDRPVKELIGYSKDLIKAGEEKTITVTVNKDDMKYYDVDLGNYAFENGKYIIAVGASSRDIKLKEKIKL
ncbi:MAG: glycoside hydrolase family 3 C-terminal domain-containing protein, partial [Clostridia bacterium]|nr:glycoside hydrolase family 3 C-terminal domain-containing protein [Clostridia bacterium]